jgi:hypothetical protein
MYINIYQIRRIIDPHEIFLHLLDVIAVQLDIEWQHNEETGLKDGNSDLPHVARTILCFIEKQPDQPDGVDVVEIAKTTEEDADVIE